MASKRKKAQKHKDFVKPKLRVGKTAAKPSNHTSTDFVAKTISLPNQSLTSKSSHAKLSSDRQHEISLVHHLSLTKHHSLSTRKESLSYVEAHLPSNPSLYKQVFQAVTPMMLDQSRGVRAALVLLLGACARKQPALLELHAKPLALYIHLAMTHIVPDIRNDSCKFLGLLVEHAPFALARMHFTKTLRSFFSLMAWTLTSDKKAVSMAVTTSSVIGGSAKKARIGHLDVLRQFLMTCLLEKEMIDSGGADEVLCVHPHTMHHMLPRVPHPYASMDLFAGPSVQLANLSHQHGRQDGKFSVDDLDTVSTQDKSVRVKLMTDVFLEPMQHNLRNLIREGGEVGRAANSCIRVLEQIKKEEDK